MKRPPRGVLVIDSSDAGHVIAAFNPLIIAVFTRIPRDEELAVLRRRASDGIEAKIAGGVLYVIARKDMSGGIDPRVRAVFEEMIDENQTRSGKSAVVVLSSGFAAAMVRSAVGGLLRLVNRRQMLRVFGAVEEACQWLAAEHGLDADELRGAYVAATVHIEGLPR